MEIGLGLVYGYLWIILGPSIKLLLYSLYSAILTLVIITDVEHHLILNVVIYPACVVGLVGSILLREATWWRALVGGGIGLGFFFLAALIGRALFGSGALGGGDVKLAFFVGIITGYPLVIEAIVLAILVGATVSLVVLFTGIRGLRDRIPYGPFLAVGAMLTLLWGHPIAAWFLP